MGEPPPSLCGAGGREGGRDGRIYSIKGSYQYCISVPSGPQSLLFPCETQHFESISSISRPWSNPTDCLLPVWGGETLPLIGSFREASWLDSSPLPSLLFFLSGRLGLVMGEQGRTALGLRTKMRPERHVEVNTTTPNYAHGRQWLNKNNWLRFP